MGFYHPATLVKDAQRHGTEVFPIDVAHSGWKCRWEDGNAAGKYRSVIVGSGTLVVEGRLQKQDGTLSIKGERFWPLRQFPSRGPCDLPGPPNEAIPSHDFH